MNARNGQQQPGWLQSPLVVAAVGAVIAGTFTVVGAFIQRGTGVIPAAQPSTTSSSTSESSPSAESSASESGSASSATASDGGASAMSLELAYNSYFDVDSRMALSDDERGVDFYVAGNTPRLLPSVGVRMVIVPKGAAVTAAGCQQGTRLVDYQLSLDSVEDDEAICVLSTDDSWFVFTVVDIGNTYATLDYAEVS